MKTFDYNRRDFLKTIGMGAAAFLIQGCTGASTQIAQLTDSNNAEKPNFIIILVDDLGWADTCCYGSKYYETPNIDKLAAQGMLFTNGYAACAVCSPTRAAVLTGRYPARIGITDWIHFYNFKGDRTSPHQKQSNKYVADKGKMLLTPPNPYWMKLDEVTIAEILKPAGYTSCHIGKWHLGPDAWYPDKQGFDYNIAGCDIGQPPSYFDPYRRSKHRPNIPTLKPQKKGQYLTDREALEAVHFIKKHRNKPFFLYMAHYAVHTPIQAKKELIEKYKAKKPTNQKNPKYAAMVESVDDAVGKITAALDEFNLTDNTVVIFTSDNGGLWPFATDNTPLRAGKGYPYEGGIREPLIIRWPVVVKAGSVCHTPVTSIDYLPTICQAAGLKPPIDRFIDGENLLPLLKQTGPLKRDAIYWHYPHYRGKTVPYSIVRQGSWKLIKHYEGKRFELFNLKDDISEKNDLSRQMPEKVEALDTKLIAWLKATGAKLPKNNPDYNPTAESKRKAGDKK